MKKNGWTIGLIIAINLILVCWVMIRFVTILYPVVGHDYSLALPAVLDSYLHFKINGLTIQWYTPSFGGGLPAFPNPNNSQFSLWTLFTFLVQPFQAIMLAAILYIILGGLACVYFLRRVIGLGWPASILGMIFFSANGFMLQRLAVGHLGYHMFPLLAIILILWLDPHVPKIIAGLSFALIVAMLIQQSGYTLIIVFGLSLLMALPFLYLKKPDVISWKRMIVVFLVGAGAALVISLSKLTAVYAFSRSFPRLASDSYNVSALRGLLGIVLQLLGTMNLAPLLGLIGVDPSHLPGYLIAMSGAFYGYWEFDMSLTPAVFVLIIAGGYRYLRKPRELAKLLLTNRKWAAIIMSVLAIWITIEFTLAKGLIYPILHKLPIMSSLHVNPRFAAAFILPLVLMAAILYDSLTMRFSSKLAWSIFAMLNVLSLVPLVSYFMIKADLQDRIYNVTESQEIYRSIRSGDPMVITGIVSGVGNTGALFLRESNLEPYEPIFGYLLENFHPEIHPGSIWEITDGYYNMTDPTGYVFPGLNESRPFQRIPVSEKSELLAFASHKQPNWKLPLYQVVLDWVSGAGFIIVTGLLISWVIRKFIISFRNGTTNKVI